MKKTNVIGLTIAIAFLIAGCASPLHDAVRRGDVSSVSKLINQGVNINETDFDWDEAPLHIAAKKGNAEIVTLLLDRGANVNQIYVRDNCYNGFTPLHFAVYFNHANVVGLLLQRGADPSISSRDYHNPLGGCTAKTPLMTAQERGYTDIARLISKIASGGRIEVADENPQEEARFIKVAHDYLNAATKPPLPEDARKFKVQAEVAVREKQFGEEVIYYGKALDIAPWWPEGHFNRAIILGETGYFLGAIREMKRYLTLVPDASNARAAQDKIYEWEARSNK